MIKNLFGQKKVPTPSGTVVPKVDHSRWVKTFEVKLTNMQDAPTYQLTHQLSVGSEIGNIVINDPSISPRHATFILQEEVVSIIDYNSMSGTFVNGSKIPPGKYIILEESDVIKLGDLDIKVLIKNKMLSEAAVPPLPVKDVPVTPVKETASVNELNPQPKEYQKKTPPVRNPVAGKKKVTTFAIKSFYSANALVRLAAVVGDFILAYIVMILLMPFDEFRELLDLIPTLIADSLNFQWGPLWGEVKHEYGAPAEMLGDVVGFIQASFNFLPLILIFCLIRIATTFLFGITISEMLLGIRAGMNGIWNRVGGALRVLIGFITGPFIIFDSPAIMSRRTFKEVITYTHLYIGSSLWSFIGILLYIPILLALALVAPLFQGLELPQRIAINTEIDQRIKVSEPAAVPATTTDALPANTVPVDSKRITVSNLLGLELKYSPEEVTVLPAFNFVVGQNKLQLQGKVALILKQKEDWFVEVELLKTFDMRQLLSLGMRANIFLFERYPQINDFAHSSPETAVSYKTKKEELSNDAFAKEFIDLMKTSFELDQDNLLQVMQLKSPLIKNFVDFKSSLLDLVEYKDFANLGFIKIGNITFLKLSYLKQKPFDLLVPLMKGKGRIFKVTYDKDRKKENATLANTLYKFILFESSWMPTAKRASGEVLTPLEVVDTFTIDYKQDGLSLEKAQALYGYYFENSAQILGRNSSVEYGIWMSSVEAVMRIVDTLKPVQVEEGGENPREKLIQNFRDLKNALDNKNLQFFGVAESTNV